MAWVQLDTYVILHLIIYTDWKAIISSSILSEQKNETKIITKALNSWKMPIYNFQITDIITYDKLYIPWRQISSMESILNYYTVWKNFCLLVLNHAISKDTGNVLYNCCTTHHVSCTVTIEVHNIFNRINTNAAFRLYWEPPTKMRPRNPIGSNTFKKGKHLNRYATVMFVSGFQTSWWINLQIEINII